MPLRFRVSEQKIVKKKQEIKPEKQRKEESKMSLSLGTWILLIIVMLVVAKIAHKLSLKTIFRPAKRSTKYIKKEWDDA